MINRKCDYGSCAKEATVKGFVLSRTSEGKHDRETVYACDAHKKRKEFFETENV